uniref:Uncharacterized protein n=1 Tax=Arundo donax TaxID=35708 RepID=A0A0A9DB02_ARUDO
MLLISFAGLLESGRMLFDLNKPLENAEEDSAVVAQEASAVAPQEDVLVASQHQKPLPVPTAYPSNLFQPGEGLQLQGILNNNAFKHASSGSGFQPFCEDASIPLHRIS